MLAGGGAGSMASTARAPLRSSARLSTSTGGGGGGGDVGGAAAAESAARAAARSAEAAAAAARRRARAAERALEVEDSPRVLRDKCRLLARALRNAKHLVVYTGAGISTAADIPDYRGPRGVWTRLQRGETIGRVEVSRARPTLTHMALTALWARGTLKFVVSQNCDGLHVRAGLPRRALAELHGNMFAERCAACRRVYLRAFDTTERTARHAHGTRRLCHACGAELADTIVHFGERGRAAWPLNWAGALRHAAQADVVLCLGSSLKVLRRYPRLWRMHRAPHQRPALYIVNLQWTPKDAAAALKINARCDQVMALVARRLRLRVPRYSPRADPLLAHAVPLAPPEAHTTRRPLLSPPPPRSPSPSPCPSPAPSDSDEELPLRRLAERLRAPPPPPAPAPAPPPAPPPLPPPPDLLHAFQVSMVSGEATILLRAYHAPSAHPARAASPGPGTTLGPRRVLSDLRRFRMCRPPRLPAPAPAPAPAPGLSPAVLPTLPPALAALTNGHAPPAPTPPALSNGYIRPELHPALQGCDCGWHPVKCESNDVIKYQMKCEQEFQLKVKCEQDSKCLVKCKAEKRLELGLGLGLGLGLRLKAEAAAQAEAEASALAATIIARAVLLCRASLYPGLHTILAQPPPAPAAPPAPPAPPPAPPPPPPPPPAVQCEWCWRRLRARRCAWYGPPPAPHDVCAAAKRAWRRVRARRYLCACCPDGGGGGGATPDPDPGGGGWYGKGYRKGRRRPLRR